MSVNIFGSGYINLVILHGLGAKNPVKDFELLVNKLTSETSFKVILIEYFGCGSSDDTLENRNNENIVEEIRYALKSISAKSPYILISHSISGLYSFYYVNKYPNEVFAIVEIDIPTPKFYLEYFTGEQYQKLSLEDAKKMGATVAHLNEWNEMRNNARELENFKYPKNLNVISFLSSYNVNEMNKAVKEKMLTKNFVQFHEEIITNNEIQRIKILDGNHWLYRNQYNKICDEIKILTDNLRKDIQ